MAVFTLVTVAGCSTLVSDGDGGQQRDPFDVPERTTATTVSERTAAVSGPDQFENGSRLASAHRFALEGQSFVLRQERVVRAPNGTVLRKDRVRGRVAANRTRYALSEEHWERDRQWVATRYWSAGADRPVVQVREDSGPAGYVEYVDETGRPLRVSDVLDRDVTVRTRLVRILSATAGRNVTRVERNGTAVYVIDGEIGQGQGAWLVRNATDPAVRNVSVLAVVARQGLVERLELRYGSEPRTPLFESWSSTSSSVSGRPPSRRRRGSSTLRGRSSAAPSTAIGTASAARRCRPEVASGTATTVRRTAQPTRTAWRTRIPTGRSSRQRHPLVESPRPAERDGTAPVDSLRPVEGRGRADSQ